MQQSLVRQRILFIAASLDRMDAASAAASLAKLLPQDQFDLRICLLDQSKPWTPDWMATSLRPTFVNRHWRFDPIAFQRLRAYVRQFQPHVIHSWDADSQVYGFAAGWPHPSNGPKLICEWEPKASFAYFARKADHLVLATDAGQNWQQRGRMLPQRCTAIPRGIMPISSDAVSGKDLRSELGIPADAKLIAAIGPLQRRLRWKELIWAIDQLKAVDCPPHLLIVGDGPYRTELVRYRRLNRVAERVHFLGNRQDWREILSRANLLWHAGLEAGDRIPILQALSAGVPVVAVDAAGIRDELITHGENGYLTAPKERAGFARWSLTILENANLARQFADAGRARAQGRWMAVNMVTRYADLYRSCG